MKLIIGLIFGVVIFIFLKRFWQKNSNSNTPNAAISYGLIFLATLVFIAIVDFTIRYFEIIKGDLFVQRNPSEIIKNINIKKYRSDGNIHPYLLYTSTPNFKGVLPLIEPGKNFKISINNHGFRTKDFYPKLPWKVRIIIMGDSFMWGYNANQDETAAAVLEKIIHQKISKDVEVLCLGVPSYSVVQYASLARIYLDYLDPDIVIVAVDQSDFIEDATRFDEYILDSEGYPFVLKNAEELLEEKESAFLALDVWGNIVKEKITYDLNTRIRIGSPLAEAALLASDSIIKKSKPITNDNNQTEPIKTTENNFAQHYPGVKIISYKELTAKFGEDISPGLPMYVARDMIPYTFDRAIKEYQNTYKSLEYIRNETSRRDQALYFSSYPYPMMITPFENIDYHVKYHNKNTIFDFSDNRVHPNLMEQFSSELSVTHLNTYQTFENNPNGMWGSVDPHFSTKGYALFALSLFEGVKDEIERRLVFANKQRPINLE